MGAVNLVPAQSTNHFQHKSFFFFCFLFSSSQLTNKMTCAQSDNVLPNLLDFDKSFLFFFMPHRKMSKLLACNSEKFKFNMPPKSQSHSPLSSAKRRISWAQLREGFCFWTRSKKNPRPLNNV